MNDNLPQYIETNDQYDLWQEHLMSCKKEDLVQIILSKMERDPHFFNVVYAQFANISENKENEEAVLEFYMSQINQECQERNPDCEYMVSMTERFFQQIKEMGDFLLQVKSYVTIITMLDEAVANGAGMEDDDDYLLFDAMKDAAKFLIKLISQDDVTSEQYVKTNHYIFEQMKTYEPTCDNYLQYVLDEI